MLFEENLFFEFNISIILISIDKKNTKIFPRTKTGILSRILIVFTEKRMSPPHHQI